MNHASFITCLGIGLVFAGCGNQAENSTRDHRSEQASLDSVSVRIATAQAKPGQSTREVVGTVRARWRTELEAKISGRIQEMPVEQGEFVTLGQVMVRLEARELEAQVARAEAQAALASREYERLGQLLTVAAVTQQEFDAAQSKTLAAEATLQEVQTQWAQREITAPFDGVVAVKLAEVGDLALPGKPLLVIEDPSTLRMEADVPESLMGHITLGQAMAIDLPSWQRQLIGKVVEISPQSDPATRTVLLKLELPHQPGLRSGLFGRVMVPIMDGTSIYVPSNAIVVRGQMEMVFVVDEGHAQLRLVKTGRQFNEETELLSGVSPGERVVVSSASTLRDGQPLEVQP